MPIYPEGKPRRKWEHIAIPRERLNRMLEGVKQKLRGNLLFGKQELEEKLKLIEMVKKEHRRPSEAALKRFFTPEEQTIVDEYLKR